MLKDTGAFLVSSVPSEEQRDEGLRYNGYGKRQAIYENGVRTMQKEWDFTAPNPMVGARSSKGKVNNRYQAENTVNFMQKGKPGIMYRTARRCSTYVTLEPWLITGNSLCVNAILESGIRRVIIGSRP